ncbi:hypothetical protein GCM10023189_38380 [Nibrella saemangeumensis]|uniref:Tetratricopeptide repeat-containing protein n=1 Tax=Nibrella saemangeumensis TaxID=1084526 RepID=A0ABP8NAP6_9BACT
MQLSDELLEQINAYLSGQMTAVEKEQFEDRIRQDTDLREEVATQREIKQGLAMMAQKQRFSQMHTDLQKRGLLDRTDSSGASAPFDAAGTPKVVPFPARRTLFQANWRYWAAAASVVFLVGLGWVFFRGQSGGQPQLARNEQIFDSNFSTSLKAAPATSADPDRLGAPDSGPSVTQDSVRLQEAVTALQQGRTQAAIERLTPLAQSTPGHWSASARWYLALAYLRNNQRSEAEQALNQIAAMNGHPYQQEAKAVIRQLNESAHHE